MDKEETNVSKQGLDDSKEDENDSTPEDIVPTQNIERKIEAVEFLNQEAETETEHEKTTESDSKNAKGDKMTKIEKTSVLSLTKELQEKEKCKKNENELAPDTKNDSESNNDLALSVGSLVEAKDFEEIWYPASIVEVDYDETEVLVHYENSSKKFDEWISVSSPRLRPWTNSIELGINEKISKEKVTDEVNHDEGNKREKDVIKDKIEDKPILRFKVGERCLARWRDSRKFLATISKDLGDGKYEIIFDDGFPWTCNVSRLVKVKPESDVFTVSSSPLNKSDQSPNLSNLTVSSGGEPIVSSSPAPIVPAASVPFHKHLFDPTRDFLGPKSERREMKRKLNIKDLFNIGTTKRRRTSKQEDKTKQKQPVLKVLTERQSDSKTKCKTTVKDTTQKDQVNESVLTKSDKNDNFKTDTAKNAHIEPKNISADVPGLTDLPIHKEKETEIPKELVKFNEANSSKKILAISVSSKEFDKSDDEDISKEFPAVSLPKKPKRRELQVSIENIPLIELKRNLAKYKDMNSEDVKTEDPKSEDARSENSKSEDEKPIDAKSENVMVVDANSENVKSDDVKSDYAESEDITSKHEDKSESMKPVDTTVGELKSEEVISKLKIAIENIEKNLNKCEGTEDLNVNMDINKEVKCQEEISKENKIRISSNREWRLKKSKLRRAKKLRLLRDKRVKKEVEEVKNQLIEVKRQVEEMTKQVLLKSIEASPTILESGTSEIKRKSGPNEQRKLKKQQMKTNEQSVTRELLPGEWCCKWVNGHPQGIISEVECDVKMGSSSKAVLPRRSVQVEDDRIPPGWTKHLVRRSFGSSAGQWNVVLVSPENRRFHTKVEVKAYMHSKQDENLKHYEAGLFDFGIHRRLSRKIGWDIITCKLPVLPSPAKTVSASSPILAKTVALKKGRRKTDKGLPKKRKQLIEKRPKMISTGRGRKPRDIGPSTSQNAVSEMQPLEPLKLEPEDGYVYVGSLKVQIIETLLRCPAEGCFKNFRNTTLLQMHIKHYHRELRKSLGATPKVLDLAYARTMPLELETPKTRLETEYKTPRFKMSKLKRSELDPRTEPKDFKPEISKRHMSPAPVMGPDVKIPRNVDSPKLRNALIGNQPVRRPKVLLPVRRIDMADKAESLSPKNVAPVDDDFSESDDQPLHIGESETVEPVAERLTPMDYELEISSHTVTKPTKPIMGIEKHKKRVKSLLPVQRVKQMSAVASEEDEWGASDFETRSSYPGTPDSKNRDKSMDTPPLPMSSESNDEAKDENVYINEAGERIKIVQMKREEIINCHCGFREEDGLMIQCELCLCWQHALCHNIQRESEVPEKYTCSICLNPRRGRRSQRFLHDQDRLYEGLLPGGRPDPVLRRAHELSGNLLRFSDALHALRVKSYVASKKDHPKLYLWAKDWENGDINDISEERLNSDYLNLCNIMSDVGKENLPIKTEDLKDIPLMDVRTANVDEDGQKREGQPVTQLVGSSPSSGGPALDIPISTAELERLAKSVQGGETGAGPETGAGGAAGPQPEPAIEDSACRKRLSRHIKRSHALIDARLDSIEAQIAELEAQYPSFEDDETADFFPRTKQTIQMLIRDLSNMEELGLTS